MTHPVVLTPDAVLRTDQIVEGLGIGDDMLADGRRDGFLHPVKMGHTLFYEGRELIEWIRQKGTRAKAPAGHGRVHAKAS